MKCESHPLDVDIHEEPLASGIKVHGLLICLASVACALGSLASAYLIYMHAKNFTKPAQQRQIIRILLMVPIYSIACLVSIPLYRQHVYLAAIYEFYESLVIAAFFLLLCQLLGGDIATLRNEFVTIEPKQWIPPIRLVVKCFGRKKKASSGLKWFNVICVGVLQFCCIKFLGALVKCITEAADVYCKESTSAKHAKIWVMVIEIVSLVSAMMCLLQFYSQVKERIAQHQPMLKFLSIKLVIMVFYIQSFVFNLLTKPGGAIKPSATISYPSWAVGIPNTLLCIEMALVSIVHLYAFPYKPYQSIPIHRDEVPLRENESYMGGAESDMAPQVWMTKPSERTQKSVGSAMLEALAFKDIFQGIKAALHWLFVLRKQQRVLNS